MSQPPSLRPDQGAQLPSRVDPEPSSNCSWLGRTLSVEDRCAQIVSTLEHLFDRIQACVTTVFEWIGLASLYRHMMERRGGEGTSGPSTASERVAGGSSTIPPERVVTTVTSRRAHRHRGEPQNLSGAMGDPSAAGRALLSPNCPMDSLQAGTHVPVEDLSPVDAAISRVGLARLADPADAPSGHLVPAVVISQEVGEDLPLTVETALASELFIEPQPHSMIEGSRRIARPWDDSDWNYEPVETVYSSARPLPSLSRALVGKTAWAYQHLTRDRAPFTGGISVRFMRLNVNHASIIGSQLFRFSSQPILRSEDGLNLEGEEWLPSFGNDSHLFSSSGNDQYGLCLESLLTLEHPILLNVLESLIQQNQNGRHDLQFDRGRLNGRAVCFSQVPRYGRLDLSGEGRQLLWGSRFPRAEDALFQQRLIRMEEPTLSNIFAVETPLRGSVGSVYTQEQILELFHCICQPFMVIKLYYSHVNIYVQGGDWGAEEYGQNSCLIQLLQMAAARVVGIPLKIDTLGSDGVSDRALALFQRHEQEYLDATLGEYLAALANRAHEYQFLYV